MIQWKEVRIIFRKILEKCIAYSSRWSLSSNFTHVIRVNHYTYKISLKTVFNFAEVAKCLSEYKWQRYHQIYCLILSHACHFFNILFWIVVVFRVLPSKSYFWTHLTNRGYIYQVTALAKHRFYFNKDTSIREIGTGTILWVVSCRTTYAWVGSIIGTWPTYFIQRGSHAL